MANDIQEAVHALCRKMAKETDTKKLKILKQQMRVLLERESMVEEEETRIGRQADGRSLGRWHAKQSHARNFGLPSSASSLLSLLLRSSYGWLCGLPDWSGPALGWNYKVRWRARKAARSVGRSFNKRPCVFFVSCMIFTIFGYIRADQTSFAELSERPLRGASS
jgi:hypothetical protein